LLAFFGYRLESSKYSDFIAHSAPASAAIDTIKDGAPIQNYGAPPSFNEYAQVHYEVAGEVANSTVTLTANCTGVCLPIYNVGERIRVAYDTRNVSSAIYPVPHGRLGLNPLGWNYLILLVGFLGILSLAAALLNMILGTAPAHRRPCRYIQALPAATDFVRVASGLTVDEADHCIGGSVLERSARPPASSQRSARLTNFLSHDRERSPMLGMG
jgi:hypothetical protein